jgi:hypothetical protein
MSYNLISVKESNNFHILTIVLPILTMVAGIFTVRIISCLKRRRYICRRNPSVESNYYDTIDEMQLQPIQPPECPPRPAHTLYLDVLGPYVYDEVGEPKPMWPWIKPLQRSSENVAKSEYDRKYISQPLLSSIKPFHLSNENVAKSENEFLEFDQTLFDFVENNYFIIRFTSTIFSEMDQKLLFILNYR